MGVARSELGESLEQGLAGRALALEPGRLPGLVREEVAPRIEVREREGIGLSGGEAIEVVDGEAVAGARGERASKFVAGALGLIGRQATFG